ncbi:hypothetical protein NST83_16860 [Paenibacillus sp. FSL R10-2782]
MMKMSVKAGTKAAVMSLFQASKRRLLANVRKLKNPNEYTFVFMGDS